MTLALTAKDDRALSLKVVLGLKTIQTNSEDIQSLLVIDCRVMQYIWEPESL